MSRVHVMQTFLFLEEVLHFRRQCKRDSDIVRIRSGAFPASWRPENWQE